MFKSSLNILLIFIFVASWSFSQEEDKDEVKVLYRKVIYGGVNVATNGWGITLNYGWQKNYKYRQVVGFTAANIKHEKEVKSFSPYYEDAKGFFYGKLNSLISFRPHYGGQAIMFNRLREKGVEISFMWSVGASLTLIKPVYLEVRKFEGSQQILVKERYDPSIHNRDNIYGRAGWFNGFGESNFNPGIFAKAGFFFDFASNHSKVFGVEFGCSVDTYFSKIEVMHGSPSKFLFPSLYANILFGGKLF
ncbi:MAG: hypothetical protein KDC84_01760 [Crocinitomicaceae bacterium]|nr:hypothetical protein [Crocinitomicaceae bacterium]